MLGLALAAGLVACGHHRPPAAGEPSFGVYRARLESVETGRARRARALVYAAWPDRIHVEIVSAVGTTHAILDAGAGRLAITVPRDRISYVGEADSRAVGALLGLRASPEILVRALLSGDAPDLAIERSGADGALPDRLRLRTDDARLDLRLRSRERVRGDVEKLGSGSPPDGMETRPLADLIDGRASIDEEDP